MSHEEACELIHLSLDGSLNHQQKRLLEMHLMSCAECQQYADSLGKMEALLRPVMQRQWAQQPIPLPTHMLVSRNNIKIPTHSIMLATRIMALGVMFTIFLFSAWQFTLSGPANHRPSQVSVPLIPIPSTSTQLVATNTQNEVCEETTYVVQENDTLESIGIRFGISKAELAQANKLKDEAVHSGAKIIIPRCKPAPTSNTLTKTFTPVLNTITSTPGG